jgi:RNA polymerase sigma-70 factor, ECF subfamily
MFWRNGGKPVSSAVAPFTSQQGPGAGYTTLLTTTEPDEQLALRAATGDTEAFATLVDRYKRPVHALAYRLLGNSADAEDAAQETFVRAYTRMYTYQPTGRFGSWILAITSHWCIDHLRRRRAVSLDADGLGAGIEAGLTTTNDMPETLLIQSERQGEVRQWVTSVPEPYRTVLILRYWHDLSYAEISEKTGLPVSTIRMRLFRARQFLWKTRAIGQFFPQRADEPFGVVPA